MKESVTYQAILREGREEGREEGIKKGREVGRKEGREEGREVGREEEGRRILLALGTKRFGKPSAKVRKVVAGIADAAVFERLAGKILDVDSWSELLAGL